MAFHPDSNLPDCMMLDGGECCAGHAAVCKDWHWQVAELARRTTERDYHMRIADILAEKVSNFEAVQAGWEDIIKRATEIVMHGRTTTYPSITSAEHVRNVMAELAMAMKSALPPIPGEARSP